MAKTVKSIGTGITAKQRVCYSGEDMPPAFKRWAENWNRARNEGGGDYGGAMLPLLKHAQWVLDGDGPDGHDTQKGFARRIIELDLLVRRCLQEGDAENAARFAFDIGYLYSQASMKGKWENHALRGLGIVKAAKAGNEAVYGTDAQKRERWRAIYNDWQAEKRKGTRKAALVVAQRHGVSERQVYRTLEYLKKD